MNAIPHTTATAVALVLLASACSGPSVKPRAAAVPPAVLALTPPPANADPAQQLSDLLAAEWQRWLARNPEEASLLGDHRFDDRWTDYSIAAIETGNRDDTRALMKLLEIDRDRLSAADQLNFELYRQ